MCVTYTTLHTHTHTHIYIYIYIHIYIYINVHTYIKTEKCNVCMCVYIYIYLYARTHVHTHTYTHASYILRLFSPNAMITGQMFSIQYIQHNVYTVFSLRENVWHLSPSIHYLCSYTSYGIKIYTVVYLFFTNHSDQQNIFDIVPYPYTNDFFINISYYLYLSTF
jgi:hypothetical protein